MIPVGVCAAAYFPSVLMCMIVKVSVVIAQLQN